MVLVRSANCLGTDQASANCSVITGCEEEKREHIKEINFPTLRIYSWLFVATSSSSTTTMLCTTAWRCNIGRQALNCDEKVLSGSTCVSWGQGSSSVSTKRSNQLVIMSSLLSANDRGQSKALTIALREQKCIEYKLWCAVHACRETKAHQYRPGRRSGEVYNWETSQYSLLRSTENTYVNVNPKIH